MLKLRKMVWEINEQMVWTMRCEKKRVQPNQHGLRPSWHVSSSPALYFEILSFIIGRPGCVLLAAMIDYGCIGVDA